ncbi:MAG: arginine--tRNA ligase, partial [Pseudomonadota bacterium]
IKLSQMIADYLGQLYPQNQEAMLPWREIYGQFTEPPNPQMGEYAFACFNLAKVLKASPAAIAANLAQKISPNEVASKVQNVGPYLNFFIHSEALGKDILAPILSQEFFNLTLVDQPQHIMIEYSQPNTHKVLHVGHMRNLCLGNAVVRLLRYLHHQVTAATFPGDVGTHVAKCLWYLKFHQHTPPPPTHKGAWLGAIYSLANNLLDDQEKTPQGDENKKQLTQILKELEAKQGDYYEMWKETRAWSLELFDEAYSWADIHFDRWYFESDVDSTSLELAREYYKKGLYVESEGAIGMDLADRKLGFCIMIKSDGTGMYATKDIDLAQRKFHDFKLDRSVYIVDKRQAFHFKQIFATLDKLGFKEAKNCYHLEYDFVELPSGAMSSRKGNIVPLMDLVSKMEQTIKDNYLTRYQGEWPPEEISETARMLANGAIKFGMARIDNQRKIVFEMEEWLKLDGETGPYLQYVHARIHSLCQKLAYDPHQPVDWKVLSLPPEKAVMSKLAHFNTIVAMSAEQFKPSFLCSYLYDLGKLFNYFYTECPIGRAESAPLKTARLALSQAVGLTISKGLELLGIGAPKRM